MQSEPENQPMQKKKRAANITKQDAEHIAELMAYRITETEAALSLGINPVSWRNWKSKRKNDNTFGDTLSRIRGNEFKAAVEHIKKFQSGPDSDWRASVALLKIAAPERYSEKADVNINVANVRVFDPSAMAKAAALVYGADEKKLIGASKAAGQITDAEPEQPARAPSASAVAVWR